MVDKIKVDLHLHTYYSDGTDSPLSILKQCELRNINYFSITDHNTTQAYLDLSNIDQESLSGLIPGVEVDTLYKGENIHLLVYGKGIFDQSFQTLLRKNRNAIENYNVDFLKKICETHPKISISEYYHYKRNKKEGYWKALQYVKSKYSNLSYLDIISLYKKCDMSMAKNSELATLNELIIVAKESDCEVICAHPYKTFWRHSDESKIRYLEELIDLGVNGVEVYYPNTPEAFIMKVERVVCAGNLSKTGGSDYHGFIEDVGKGFSDIMLKDVKLKQIRGRRDG
jgi:predicted metal-dependent phosphoesterase TrpH